MNDDADKPVRLNGAALGAKLRRLSAAIDADAARIYAAEGVTFEQRWFGVVNRLAHEGPMTVGSLAASLGISHASVSETRRSLEKNGLIEKTADSNDGRRRVIALSAEGRALVERMSDIWRAFDLAASALDEEAGFVSAALDRLGNALARRSLRDRINDVRQDALQR